MILLSLKAKCFYMLKVWKIRKNIYSYFRMSLFEKCCIFLAKNKIDFIVLRKSKDKICPWPLCIGLSHILRFLLSLLLRMAKSMSQISYLYIYSSLPFLPFLYNISVPFSCFLARIHAGPFLTKISFLYPLHIFCVYSFLLSIYPGG